jgi:hypothetical protein
MDKSLTQKGVETGELSVCRIYEGGFLTFQSISFSPKQPLRLYHVKSPGIKMLSDIRSLGKIP